MHYPVFSFFVNLLIFPLRSVLSLFRTVFIFSTLFQQWPTGKWSSWIITAHAQWNQRCNTSLNASFLSTIKKSITVLCLFQHSKEHNMLFVLCFFGRGQKNAKFYDSPLATISPSLCALASYQLGSKVK